MDDVDITDVDADGMAQPTKRAAPINQDLSSISQIAGDFLSQHGWYILVFTVFLYLLIQHLSKRRSRQGSPPQLEQDASLVTRRHVAMEAARRKMQEELDEQAAIFKEKLKKQEEEKRRQKIEIWESIQQGQSYKGGAKLSQATEETSSSSTVLKPKTQKKPLRSADYNPLSGQGGGSCSWRPGRKGQSSGG
ncbi:selenoprotein S [Betta splendens]|uniref:Selenoprotein S n=1 Tax=Betta splendens TaxID=158456 RepID=A0A6P7M498_BETSP|nr:selenoprotein S [Betta splendens]